MVLHVAVPNSVCPVCAQVLPATELVATVEVQLEDTVAKTECSQSCIRITDNDAVCIIMLPWNPSIVDTLIEDLVKCPV